jgi:hypothetical protein
MKPLSRITDGNISVTYTAAAKKADVAITLLRDAMDDRKRRCAPIFCSAQVECDDRGVPRRQSARSSQVPKSRWAGPDAVARQTAAVVEAYREFTRGAEATTRVLWRCKPFGASARLPIARASFRAVIPG